MNFPKCTKGMCLNLALLKHTRCSVWPITFIIWIVWLIDQWLIADQTSSYWLFQLNSILFCYRLDDRLCLSHLPRIFTSCLNCFISEKAEVAKAAAQVLKVIEIWNLKTVTQKCNRENFGYGQYSFISRKWQHVWIIADIQYNVYMLILCARVTSYELPWPR